MLKGFDWTENVGHIHIHNLYLPHILRTQRMRPCPAFARFRVLVPMVRADDRNWNVLQDERLQEVSIEADDMGPPSR